jgi:predicted nuclease of predicted toxin-antitoxin system
LKLIFDANLSPKLVARLVDLFPGSLHVFQTDLARFTSDEKIWEYARDNALTIVTADSDFLEIARQRGCPPKIIRLEKCNYKTARVEDLLRRNAVRIADLEHNARAALILRSR